MKVVLAIALLCVGVVYGSDGGEWPVAHYAFGNLVGTCEAARLYVENNDVDLDNVDTLLKDACPIVIGVAVHFTGADAVKQEQADNLIQASLPLVQCVNLEAKRELIRHESQEAGEKDNGFLREAKPMFDVCEEVFKSVQSEDHELVKMLKELDSTLLEKREQAVVNLLRQLLQIAARR